MADAILCDNCNTFLGPLDKNGEDPDGERAGWVVIEAGGMSFDCCTRACAIHLLDDSDGPLVEILEAYQAGISEVIQIANESTGDDE